MKHFRARYFLHSYRKVPEQLRMPNAFAKKGLAHKRHVFRRGQSRKDGFSWTRRSKVRYPDFRTNHVGQVETEKLAENSESRSLRIYSSARNARCPTAFRLWKTASASLYRSIPPYNSHRHRLRILRLLFRRALCLYDIENERSASNRLSKSNYQII